MAKTSGISVPEGGLNLRLNPPPPEPVGATYVGSWVKVESDDEGKGFFVRIFGEATYMDAFGQKRSCVVNEDLTDEGLEPLRAAIKQIIAAYGSGIENRAMEAAYKARSHSLTVACAICSHAPEHPPGLCSTVGCKCGKGGK